MSQSKNIAALQQEIVALRAENQRLKHSLLQHTMERAVLDEQMSPELLSHIEQFFALPLTPWYLCILFFGGETVEPMPQTAPVESISGVLTDILSAFGQPFFFTISGIVACLMNVSLPADEDVMNAGETLCHQVQNALEAQVPMLRQTVALDHIALSMVSDMKSGPRLLYRSARSASEHRKSNETVCTAHPGLPAPQDQKQLYVLEQIFWQRIQQRSFFEAATTLDQILATNTLQGRSLEQDRAAVFSRMELVLSAALEGFMEEPTQDARFSLLLRELSRAGTFQQLRDTAYDILATLEDRLYTPPNGRNRKMPQIEQYIREDFANPTLCATSIAERFRISASYLSRIFKADMGIGLVDYIHKLRIDAAKVALRNTYGTIDEVAASVGFSNRWVFMRVFKKLEGTTPGAYRSAQGIPK